MCLRAQELWQQPVNRTTAIVQAKLKDGLKGGDGETWAPSGFISELVPTVFPNGWMSPRTSPLSSCPPSCFQLQFQSFPTKIHLNFGCYGMTWMVNLPPFPQANSRWFSFLATLTEAIKHLLCYRPPNRPWRRAHQLTQIKLQLVGNLPNSEGHSKDSNPGLQGPEPVLSPLCLINKIHPAASCLPNTAGCTSYCKSPCLIKIKQCLPNYINLPATLSGGCGHMTFYSGILEEMMMHAEVFPLPAGSKPGLTANQL